jgi:flagellar hook-basal body complex protein FliE
MSMPISPIQPPALAAVDSTAAPVSGSVAAAGSAGESASFQSLLTEASGRVEQLNRTAHEAVSKFLSGQGEEIHHVALALHQSETAFEMFMQVRNKVISAYQEVMRMQL